MNPNNFISNAIEYLKYKVFALKMCTPNFDVYPRLDKNTCGSTLVRVPVLCLWMFTIGYANISMVVHKLESREGEREVNENKSVSLYGQFIGQCRENEMHIRHMPCEYVYLFYIFRHRCMCKYSRKSLRIKDNAKTISEFFFVFLSFSNWPPSWLHVYVCVFMSLCSWTMYNLILFKHIKFEPSVKVLL